MTVAKAASQRRIAVVTGARSDFSHLRSVMAAVEAARAGANVVIVSKEPIGDGGCGKCYCIHGINIRRDAISVLAGK